MGHFVFINLNDTRTYCLPDGYEIIDAALNDVKKCLAPTFSMTDVAKLNSNTSLGKFSINEYKRKTDHICLFNGLQFNSISMSIDCCC
jgi:hypothetical protein